NLSKQQQVSEIMRQMLTQAQTAGQYFTNDQIKEMTRKVSAEVDLVHQQTQNQRYGSSHIGATAKDISNVVTDAASEIGRASCRERVWNWVVVVCIERTDSWKVMWWVRSRMGEQ